MNYFNNDELAQSVFEGKYAAFQGETPEQMHRRMAKRFAYKPKVLSREKLSLLSEYGASRDSLSEEDIYRLFKDFRYIIPQGSVMAVLGTNKVASLSNCFVVGQPEDSYGGIMYKDQELAQLMKRRGGVGIDISTLRPAKTKVTNSAGTSTGAASFMERYSNTTREVAQEGRRGALMITIDCRHPDVFEFVNAKKDRTKVTGANISVLLRDDFMEAVQSNSDYILRFPCDLKLEGDEIENYHLDYNELFQFNQGKYLKRIKARDLYNDIVYNAWDNAEPGQMFVDRHWQYSPDAEYPEYKFVTTNPCGEIGMSAYDACRLIVLNLFSFVRHPFTENAYIDFDALYKASYEMQVLADRLVTLELQHISAILDKIIFDDKESQEIKQIEEDLWLRISKVAESSRRTGSGFTALGDMLAALNLKYDSNKAKEIITKTMRAKMMGELDATIDMAIIDGPFVGWNKDKEFVRLGNQLYGKNPFFDMLIQEFPLQANRMYTYGRRNVSWSTVAPTGSVSILSQTTSGLEPLFQPYYIRRKKINPADSDAKIDFVDQNGDKWKEYGVLHPKFKEWIKTTHNKTDNYVDSLTVNELDQFYKISPWNGSTANDIDWISRIEIQSIIQHYTSHSISSTINVPNNISVAEVEEIYMKSWEMGLKGVTIYRDGCRTGVLVTNSTPTSNVNNADKRPKTLNGEIFSISVQGEPFTVVIGFLEADIPYEIFAFKGHTLNNCTGVIEKIKSGNYRFTSGNKEIDITSNMESAHESITRLVSMSLRHKVSIKFIVEQLNKPNEDLTKFSKSIARILKKYIENGEMSTIKCEKCGTKNIVFEQGCSICKNCGDSKCG
jgi:ribonucleoside-diphosphate reductase alpha chain